jgi:hypothetical protein
MSLQNFIPQLWADTLLAALRKNLVYGGLYNRDYEGQIRQMGDTVKINMISDITINSYTKDTDLNAPQALTDAQSMLTISQAKYYNWEVDDIDMAQAHPNVMSEAVSRAAYLMADTIDQYLAGFYSDAISGNILGTTSGLVISAPTSANAGAGTTLYDYIVQLGQKLSENYVPKKGRVCVVPPWGRTYLIQDVRFTSFNTAQARMTLQSGVLDDSGETGPLSDAYLGQIEGMDVYESVNAPHISGTVGAANSIDVVHVFHPMAITCAQGINKVEAYRPPYRFADAIKGLSLYGAKTVRPYAQAFLYAKHP